MHGYTINRKNNMQTITVEVRNNYGNELVYPVCQTAIWLTQLTGKKTLDANAIGLIKKLGYKIEHKKPNFKF